MERWVDILGYEGLYQVSNLGNVKSLDKKIFMKINNSFSIFKGRILKLHKVRKGYLSIALTKKGKVKEVFVHRLVAQAFLGLNINDRKMFVCHKDDNPSNNNKDNLFLGTNSDNILDSVSKGRHVNNKGEKHGLSKLTDGQVKEIKFLLKEGVLQKNIAKIYNIGTPNISRINTGKRWSHIF